MSGSTDPLDIAYHFLDDDNDQDKDVVIPLLWRDRGRLPLVRYNGSRDLGGVELVGADGGRVRVAGRYGDSKSLWRLREQVVLYDLETTGLHVGRDHIVQISMWNLDTNVRATRLVRDPDLQVMPNRAEEIHGISMTHLIEAGARSASETFAELFSVRGLVPTDWSVPVRFVAYNGNAFDMHFMARCVGHAWPQAWFFGDAMHMVFRQLLVDEATFEACGSMALGNLHRFFRCGPLPPGMAPHHADADVQMMYDVLHALFGTHVARAVSDFYASPLRRQVPQHPRTYFAMHPRVYERLGWVFYGCDPRSLQDRVPWDNERDDQMAMHFGGEDAAGAFCLYIKGAHV